MGIKRIVKSILPRSVIEFINPVKELWGWRNRNYLNSSPQFIKQKVLISYGIADSQWVETGTYHGTTTNFLAKNFKYVHSIEPSLELYNKALSRFDGKNVKLINNVSEDVLPALLHSLNGDINFWLDGHYSAGITFQGDQDCPLIDELKAIEESLVNFSKVTILIDDVRCFLPSNTNYSDYPSIDYLVDWARKHQFNWRIEHDIFVIQNH